MQGKVEICGVNTAKLQILSQAQMDSLLLQAKKGDENARQQLIEGNLRLVLSVIQRFEKRGESPDDLFQVGCIGLMKAIANFDPDKQVRFSTYGVPMIAGEVRRYLRDNSVIRVSRSIRDVAYRVLQCKEGLLLRLGREPTLDEIAKELDLPVVIHTRDADDATIGVLDETDFHNGIIHCFTGSVPFERKLLDRGFMVSISGIVTFRAADNVRDAALFVPDDRLLVETDSPFLAPIPKRGTENEPAFITHTVEFLANLRKTSPEALALLTTGNAKGILKC